MHLYELHTSKLPQDAISKDLSYCKPKLAIVDDEAWYYPLPVGHNILAHKLKKIMFEQAALDMNGIQNHSLCAMSISWMYEKGVPEKIIMG